MDRSYCHLAGEQPIGYIADTFRSPGQRPRAVTREREAKAAVTLRECQRALAARGSSVIREAIGAGQDPVAIADWRHYPAGEAYDPATHVQYFYHRHPAAPGQVAVGPPEHGHFHLFLRGEGVPAGVAPLLLPEAAVANAPLPRQSAPLKRGDRDEVCHLLAISLDCLGQPIRLFATNRWVTGETWYRAEDVIGMVARFRLASEYPCGLLNRWLAALVRLFQPEIAELLRERDRVVLERRWRWRTNVLEDPRLEIAASREIDLAARLAKVEADREAPAAAAAIAGPARLPRMADGWGA